MPDFERITGDIYFLKIPFGPVFAGVSLIDGEKKLDGQSTKACFDHPLIFALPPRS